MKDSWVIDKIEEDIPRWGKPLSGEQRLAAAVIMEALLELRRTGGTDELRRWFADDCRIWSAIWGVDHSLVMHMVETIDGPEPPAWPAIAQLRCVLIGTKTTNTHDVEIDRKRTYGLS